MENIIDKILVSQRNSEEKKNYFNFVLSQNIDKINFLMILIEKTLQDDQVCLF